MKSVCVINVVGLTPRHLGKNTPNLTILANEGQSLSMQGVVPAVTCSAQASMLTGLSPQQHGVVGNGWHFRETGETRFWLQSNQLVQGEKFYETARRRAQKQGKPFTCAKLFWWFNQGAAVDFTVTPKPHYGADGSKEFDIQSTPDSLQKELKKHLGEFPFFSFWGPRAGLPSSEWITKAAIWTIENHRPDLSLVYLPHLDYDFQRFGPSFEGAESRLQEVDELVGNIAKAAKEQGSRVIVVSEYGIQPVTQAIHINRHLREKSWLQTRSGPFGEMLDPFQSKVFAVADHQVAHVYVREKHFIPTVREFLLGLPGIESAFAGADRDAIQLNHSHAGDLVAIAKPNAWFTYYYWLDDRLAPDFARTVDIHRKPGYDPCELFINPNLPMPGLLAATKILKKKLGMRYLMDLIPLDATLVRGSHGAPPRDPLDGPIWICNFKQSPIQSMSMTQVPQKVLEAMELDD